MSNINDVVSERIKNISTPVFDKVVDAIVSKETDKRADAIVKVMERIDEMQKELRRMKPDQGPFFDDEGKETAPGVWSKAKLEERKKLREKIAKHQSSVEKALEGDMEQLYKLAQGN